MPRITMILTVALAGVLAACGVSEGGPSGRMSVTPEQAIILTAPAAEQLRSGTALDLSETPTRKITGMVFPDTPSTYPITVSEAASADFSLQTPLESGVTFMLTGPDGTVLVDDALEYTGELAEVGVYTLEISSDGDPSGGMFVMDVGVQLEAQPTGP